MNKNYYSGNNSRKFWRKINSFKGTQRENLYSMGVRLQNLEDVVLKELEAAMKPQETEQ